MPSSQHSGNGEAHGSGDVVEFGRQRGPGPLWRRPGVLLLACLVAAALAVVAWPLIDRGLAPSRVRVPVSQFPVGHTQVRSLDSPWCGRRIAQGCSFRMTTGPSGRVAVVHVSVPQVPGP